MRGTSDLNTMPSIRTGAKVSVRNTYYAAKGFQGYNKILEAENGKGEVFLGAIRGSLSDRDNEALEAEGITANAQFVEPKELAYFEADGRKINVSADQAFHLSIPDETPFTELHFPEIKKGLKFIADKRKNGGKVYVNCYSGVGRSACIMILFVMQDQKLSAQKALEFIQKVRPQVNPKPRQFLAVLEFDFWDKKDSFIENRSPENSENLLTAFKNLLNKSQEELGRVFRTGDSKELESFMPTLHSLRRAALFILRNLDKKNDYPANSAKIFHENLLGLFKMIAELSALHGKILKDENTGSESPKKVTELIKMNELIRAAINKNEYMKKVEVKVVCEKLIEATQNASKKFDDYINKRSNKITKKNTDDNANTHPEPPPSKKVAVVISWKRRIDEKLDDLTSKQGNPTTTLEDLEQIQKDIIKIVSIENNVILISGTIKDVSKRRVDNTSSASVAADSETEDDRDAADKPGETPLEFTIKDLKHLSQKNDSSPILINDQGKISIYGKVKGDWCITPLNSELFDPKKFPAPGEKEKEIIGFNISDRTRKEIKKGHRPHNSSNPLLELIRELKEAIKYLFDIGRGKRAESEDCIYNVKKASEKSLERNCAQLYSFFPQKRAVAEGNAAPAEAHIDHPQRQ